MCHRFRFPCQLAHLGCHDSKAASCFSGMGSFNSSIQCQQVRLAGNPNNFLHYIGKLIHFFTNHIRTRAQAAGNVQQIIYLMGNLINMLGVYHA